MTPERAKWWDCLSQEEKLVRQDIADFKTAIKNSYETIEKARADISVLKEQKEEYENTYIEAKTALDKMKGEDK